MLFLTLFRAANAFAGDPKGKDIGIPCGFTDSGFDTSSDVQALQEYQNAIAALFRQEKFAELDCVADWARSSKAKFSGGTWKLRNVYRGLDQPRPGHPTEEDWQTHLRLLEEWNKKNPRSLTAPIALADFYINYAWDARGHGYGDSVSESGWKLFRERLGKAKTILDRPALLAGKCPEWYLAMEQIAQGQGWDLARVNALADRLTASEPGYYYAYRVHASTLLPRWQGQEGDAARFAEDTANRIGGDAGDTLYFQIASSIVCCAADDAEFSHFSWPRLQSGFAALEKKYGTSLNNLNEFALLAVKAGDSVAADAAFKRIGDRWDEDVWHTEVWFKGNKDRSAQLALVERRNRRDQEEARANMQTAEGALYQKAVAQKLDPIARACAGKAGSDRSKLELLMLVSAEGDVLEIRPNSPSLFVQCLMRTLFAPHQTKNAPLAAPPHPQYWVALDVDPAVVNTAAQ